MEFHFIQEQILKKLIATEKFARYSSLRIKEIENDLFNYHLQKQVKSGIVDKFNEGYSLSTKGKQVTEDVVPLGVIRSKADQFKLYSHGIVVRKDSKDLQILNRKRTKQPFYGDKGILGESVRKGQDVKSALSSRLKSQAGISVDPKNMKLAGVLRKITLDKNKEVFSDFIFNIFFCLDYEGSLDKSLDNANLFWVNIKDAIQNEEDAGHPFPSLVKILKELQLNPSLKNYSPIFAEDFVQITIN